MRVLLISPVRDVDPFCGDVVYTEQLLAAPPAGVTYTTYVDALREGTLRERGRRDDLRRDRSGRAAGRVARERLVNEARRRGVLFREPFRHWEVDSGAFDLVHTHVFSSSYRWSARALPVVTSNALPLDQLYLRARGWSRGRVAAARVADRWLARALRVEHSAFALRSSRPLAFSQALADYWRSTSPAAAPAVVIPPAVPALPHPKRESGPPWHLLFVAGDFVSKGGPETLGALAKLRDGGLDVDLTIVGSPPPAAVPEGVVWLPWVQRERLLSDLLPRSHALVHPTHFDGLPLVAVEALAAGLPVITTDYFAMPEVAAEGAGATVREGDAGALAEALRGLLQSGPWQSAHRAAKALHAARFSPQVTQERLARTYEEAVAAR